MPTPMLPWSLQGTIFGDLFRSTSEVDEARKALELSQAANQAAAGGAFQQYQGAAATPLAPPSPLDALPQLFSNFASIISQRPEFAERRQQSDAAIRAEALQKRSQNIQALRDNYERLAQQAAKIDPVQAIKWQEKVAAQDKVLETMRDNLKFVQAQQLEEQKSKGQFERAKLLADARIRAAQLKPKTAGRSSPYENTSLGFYLRANESLGIIETPDPQGTALEDKIRAQSHFEQQRGRRTPGFLSATLTPEQRQYRQAQRAFTEARLRRESGATIRPDEYQSDAETYFFEPGDDEKTLANKRRLRMQVVNALRKQSGRAYDEYFGAVQEGEESPDSRVETLLDQLEPLVTGGP